MATSSWVSLLTPPSRGVGQVSPLPPTPRTSAELIGEAMAFRFLHLKWRLSRNLPPRNQPPPAAQAAMEGAPVTAYGTSIIALPHLPPIRKRSLSLSRDDGPETGFVAAPSRKGPDRQATLDQSNSILFSLPQELRLCIYQAIFGDRVVHIEGRYYPLTHRWNVWHCVCASPVSSLLLDPCPALGEDARTDGSRDGNLDEFRRRFRRLEIGVLLTCRQVYSEAIPLLYSSNEFRFQDPICLKLFPDVILTKRLATVRSIAFHWKMDFIGPHYKATDETEYQNLWAWFKKTFPGLRNLNIDILTSWKAFRLTGQTDETIANAWLAPMENFRNVHLTVTISAPYAEILCPVAQQRGLTVLPGENRPRI